MRLSIIIPAYNEENRIRRTLEEYCCFFRKKHENFEILVVLNACKDNTIGVVKNCKKKFKEIEFIDLEQGGKGFAIIEGFREALNRSVELIGFVDADMATSPEAFYDIVKNVGEFGGVIASRRLPGAKVKGKTLLGIVKSSLFNFVVRSLLVLPYRDTQCGAKVFKKKIVEEIIEEIGTTRWAFDVDLLYQIKRKGFKLGEIATVWTEQEGSKHDVIRASLRMFSAVVRLRVIHSPFEFVVKAYNQLPEWAKVNHYVL